MLSRFVATVFDALCAQHPGHVWQIGPEFCALCQRCLGVYAGASLALVTSLAFRARRSELMHLVHGFFVLQVMLFGFHLVPQDGTIRTLSGQLFSIGSVWFLMLLPNRHFRLEQRTGPRTRAYLLVTGASLLLLQVLPRTPLELFIPIMDLLALIGLAGALAMSTLNLVLLTRHRPT